MSCHVGFEDLTDSRRRALINLLHRVEMRRPMVERFIKNEFCRTHKRLLESRPIRHCLLAYDYLAQKILAQFPETRWEILGSPNCEPQTNRQLHKTLAYLDADLARKLNVPAGDLLGFFEEMESI